MTGIKAFFGADRKKLIGLAVLCAIGAILIIIGTYSGEKVEENTQKTREDAQTKAYIADLENKIKNITEQITGDKSPAVMVSVGGGIESVYACDSRTGAGSESIEYITVRDGDGAGSPVLIKQIYPSAEGVSVACRGGDDAKTQSKLIRAISTALGISSNRICIIGTN